MEKELIQQKIFSTMSVVFEVPETELSEESSSDTIASWDSLRHLNMILALEEEFGVSIPDEEVGNMVNYRIIFHVLNDTLENGRN